MRRIYLDYAAATPPRPDVLEAMSPYINEHWHNASSVYLDGRTVAQALSRARGDCASVLGCKPGEIIFTSGSTESVNLAIAGVMRRHPKGRIALAADEHASVMQAALGWMRGRIDLIPVNKSGQVEPSVLAQSIKPSTALVSIAYANSETGAVQRLSQLVRAAKAINSKVLFHTDASAAGYLPLKVNRLGVDLLSLGGGKVYGPKSSGLLFVKAATPLEPLIYGGGQESGRRGGTEDAGNIVGLATALKLQQNGAGSEAKRLAGLRDKLAQKLSKIAGVEALTVQSTLPNVLVLLMPVTDAERLVMELDEAGVQVGTGAACSANTDEPSRALLAMGMSKADANRSLRLSLGLHTTEAEIDQAAKIIATVVQK